MAKDKKPIKKKKVVKKPVKRKVVKKRPQGLNANQRQHIVVKIGEMGKPQPVSHMPQIIQTSQPQPFVERHQQPHQQPYQGPAYNSHTPSNLDQNVYHHGLTSLPRSSSKSTPRRQLFSNTDQLGTAAPKMFPYGDSGSDTDNVQTIEPQKRGPGRPRTTTAQKAEAKVKKEQDKLTLAMARAREDSVKQRVSSRNKRDKDGEKEAEQGLNYFVS